VLEIPGKNPEKSRTYQYFQLVNGTARVDWLTGDKQRSKQFDHNSLTVSGA
jgi:hypothetical protein